MLRLGSSTVIPYALRAISTRTRIGSLIKSQSFCSAAKKQNDVKIVKILNSKIESMHFIHKTMSEAPTDFPFAIEDNIHSMILTNQLDDGEKIEAVVCAPLKEQKYLTLMVKITKQNGTKMEYKVSLCAQNISVLSMSLVEPATPNSDALLRFGPYQLGWQLDNDLVEAYAEFLEIRGINKSFVAFLHDLAIRKSTRYSISNLKEMTKFINK